MESKCSRPPPPTPLSSLPEITRMAFFLPFFPSLCPLSTPLGGAHRLPLSENEIIYSVWLSKRQKKVIIIRSRNRCKKKAVLPFDNGEQSKPCEEFSIRVFLSFACKAVFQDHGAVHRPGAKQGCSDSLLLPSRMRKVDEGYAEWLKHTKQ